MRTRPVLAVTAPVAALSLCLTAGSAGAATAAPAKGKAVSSLSLLQVAAAGHTLRLGDLAMTADTVSGKALSSITLTPLTADGTKIGTQTVTPANSPLTSPSASTPSALAGVVSLASPIFTAAATDAPSATAGASSLGSVKVLGLDIPLDGALNLASVVNAVKGASSIKTLEVKDLALPSIADLLAALGLDLSKLPIATLETLVQQLDLVTSAITTAESAASAALAQVDAATQTLADATTSVTTATGNLTAATSALQTQLDLIPAASLLGLPAGSDTVTGFLALPSATQTVLEGVVPGITGALSAFTAAKTALDTANAAVTAAQAALTALTASLQGVLAPLTGLLTGVLDSTPLLSIDDLAITSKAVASSNKAGGQQAEVLGGSISGLHVLGTDVLDNVLGSSTVDLSALVGSVADQLTAAVAGLTGTLSSVLSAVPGLPELVVPAPQISLLKKTTSTSISGGYGRALASVTGLSIALPAISLPAALAVPNAASLPGVSAVGSLLTSAPVTVGIGTISDQAAFAPAVVASNPQTTPQTPSTPQTPPLASTGLPVGLAALALLFVGAAVVVRRRAQQQ